MKRPFESYDWIVENYPWWKEIIDETFAKIKKKWLKYTTSYVKEKYGWLRFDWWWDEEAVDLICELELSSEYTCDTCWKFWKVRSDLWRWRCLCKKHYKEKLNSKKE